MPAVGDIVQIVVEDNLNRTNSNKYIRYMVYEGEKDGFMIFTARSWKKTQIEIGHTEMEPKDFKEVYTGNVINPPKARKNIKITLNHLAK